MKINQREDNSEDDKVAALAKASISVLRTSDLTHKHLLAWIKTMRANGCPRHGNRLMEYLQSRVSAFRNDTETLREIETRLAERN
jgi:hypothetical protein